MRKIAIVLIVIGLGLSIFSAATFFTKEKVVEVGNVKISRDKAHHLNWSPFIGVGIIVLGGIVFLIDIKK
jgi:uncharacterized membrane protein YidH (DUF202 family)